jgi:hypothetical protein
MVLIIVLSVILMNCSSGNYLGNNLYRSDRDFLLRFGGWLGPSETTIYSQFV